MSPSGEELTVFQANLLAAVVALPGSKVRRIGDAIEAAYGVDLPKGRVYTQVSRLHSMGLVEKSEPRGARGKSITPTAAGRDLAEERYDWIVDSVGEAVDR